MNYPPESLAIRAPAQIGPGIDGSGDRLPKKVWRTEWQDTPQHVQQRNVIDGQRRFAGTAPYLLIRIGEERIAYFGKP
jgi:hypothetical protein